MAKEDLDARLKAARKLKMTAAAKERQRRSFAYGNTHLENDRITRSTIDKAAERLSARESD